MNNYISNTNNYMFKVYKADFVNIERLIWKLWSMYIDVKNFVR